MPSISLPAAIIGAGVIGGGAAIIGGSKAAGAATKAADVQAASANRAADIQKEMYDTTRNDLAPFRDLGAGQIDILKNLLPGGNDPFLKSLEGLVPGSKTPAGSLTALNSLLGLGPDGKINPDLIQSTLESTPGYKFTLDQGLKSTQNSFAAKGLGTSGAALKGAATFATGLANQTYESRLQDYSANYLNQFNAASGAYGQRVGAVQTAVGTGENAAAQTGQIGVQAGANIGNNLTSAGAATAGGIVGSANAQVNALTGATGALTNGLIGSKTLGLYGSTPAAAAPSYTVGNPNALFGNFGEG